jgi:ribosomal protein S18 acetylase RimI-like enzyme
VSDSLAAVPTVGTHVTLRVATPVGPISVVGEVVEADSEQWSVRRRDGSIALVAVTSIEAGREVPAGRSATTPVVELQQIAAFGWRAQETVRLGEWLLRASGGFTQRANSVLAVGDPPGDLESALDRASGWYAERGLPLLVLQADEASPTGLVEALVERGFTPRSETYLMTGEVAHALRGMPDVVRSAVETGLTLRYDDVPDDAWYACYAESAKPITDAGSAVMQSHPSALFASLRDGERVVAVARAAVDARWAGLFAVAVASDRRREGLGAAVTLAALKEAARRGGRHAYLQVEERNEPAVALYRRLNLKVHHSYRYWVAPA